jgi:hypothetical protein
MPATRLRLIGCQTDMGSNFPQSSDEGSIMEPSSKSPPFGSRKGILRWRGVLVRNFPAHSGLAVRRITGALRHGPKRASKAASTDEHPGASEPPFIRSPRFSSRKRAGTEGLGNAAWSRTRQSFEASPADGRYEPSAGMALVPGPAAAEIEPQRSEESRAVTCLASVRSRVTPLPSQRVFM